MRIDFLFNTDGECIDAFTFEQSEPERHSSQKDDPRQDALDDISSHVVFEIIDDECPIQKTALEIINGAHVLELESEHEHETALELLATEIFKAGMVYGRAHPEHAPVSSEQLN